MVSTYLRIGSDTLAQSVGYRSQTRATQAYEKVARELDRFGQRIEGSLHFANSRDEVVEYPDRILSIGPRGGLRIERT